MVEAAQGKCCEFVINSEIYGQPVEFDQKEGDMISLRLPENKFCIAVSELGCASQAQMVAGYRPINGAIVTKAQAKKLNFRLWNLAELQNHAGYTTFCHKSGGSTLLLDIILCILLLNVAQYIRTG